ncbi:hypothetical protein MN608_09278 [Microdochium nivale]|nr:hypothetical protein MN608_09278 [Microdochium nivale]
MNRFARLMPTTCRLAQISAVLATMVCLAFAGLALYGIHFIMKNLAVPMDTRIGGDMDYTASQPGDPTTIESGYHEMTFAGLVALRLLALCSAFNSAVAAVSISLLPHIHGHPATTTTIDSASTQAQVSFSPGGQETSGVGKRGKTRLRFLCVAALAFMSSAANVIITVIYLLHNPAMRHPWSLLPRYFEKEEAAWASGLGGQEGNLARHLELGTGFWFRGDMAVACVGIVSAGVIVRWHVLSTLDADAKRKPVVEEEEREEVPMSETCVQPTAHQSSQAR